MTAVLAQSGLILSLDERLARRKGHAVRLGPIESHLLALLMQANGRPLGIEELCCGLWGENAAVNDARVRGVVKRLRGKLPAICIETIVGEGYRLCPEQSSRTKAPDRFFL